MSKKLPSTKPTDRKQLIASVPKKDKYTDDYYRKARAKREAREKRIEAVLSVTIMPILNILSKLFKFIGNIFQVIWAIMSETVSNHCPPIDFVDNITGTGTINVLGYNSNYILQNGQPMAIFIIKRDAPQPELNKKLEKYINKKVEFSVEAVELSEYEVFCSDVPISQRANKAYYIKNLISIKEMRKDVNTADK